MVFDIFLQTNQIKVKPSSYQNNIKLKLIFFLDSWFILIVLLGLAIEYMRKGESLTIGYGSTSIVAQNQTVPWEYADFLTGENVCNEDLIR